MNKNVETFIACESEYEEASIVLFGAPFDGTTSFRPGARFGSKAIRNESFGIETYSPYQDKDLEDLKVFDRGDLDLCFGNTARVLQDIEDCTDKVLEDNKIPVMIGGEHLVTLGMVRAFAKKYKDLHVVHFDAHTDLRDDYLGEKLSHATVMRRVLEIIGDKKLYQYGIRSGEKAEFKFAEEHSNLTKFDFSGLEEDLKRLEGKPVYFTIDLDVLDPSEFPGTGTPEAGGVSFKELLKAILAVGKLNIVGFDIVELSPHYDSSGRSTAIACKILREMILGCSK